MNVDPNCQWQKCRSITVVSGNISFWRYSKAFLAGTSSNLSGIVENEEFAVFLLPYLRKFQK